MRASEIGPPQICEAILDLCDRYRRGADSLYHFVNQLGPVEHWIADADHRAEFVRIWLNLETINAVSLDVPPMAPIRYDRAAVEAVVKQMEEFAQRYGQLGGPAAAEPMEREDQ